MVRGEGIMLRDCGGDFLLAANNANVARPSSAAVAEMGTAN